VLLLAIVAVLTAAVALAAAGLAVRTRIMRLEETRRLRAGREQAAHAAVQALAGTVAADTNGWDSLDESWGRGPWERRAEGWVWRVSGNGWQNTTDATTGLEDAERRIDLNTADVPLLAVLLERFAGQAPGPAGRLAAAIVAWRSPAEPGERPREDGGPPPRHAPFAAPEQLAAVPGLAADAAARLLPWVTAYGHGRLNLNTAPRETVECLLLSRAGGDGSAARRLADRLRVFREGGGVLRAAGCLDVGLALGGLPADEAALLSRAESLLAVHSRTVCGVAEAFRDDEAPGRPPARAAFVWDRDSCAFRRWVAE
jgi:type II secretory pathway component PulK